ncbi:MAG: AbrB/MazE/SpoVT family DNA-binding domain-containing protein [Clostridium sp.]|nr:AbrB/MazE/SpoVT family DNA-binding domain-containing protein [Clostridium sp.]
MKATGIVRRTDYLGRIVIPKEIRRTLRIQEGDPLEIYTEGEQIVLKKYEPSCMFCGEAKEVVNYKGKNICKNCLEEISTKYKKEDDDICKLESTWKTLK